MVVKSVLVSKRFTPKWNGNMDLPVHERMVIVFHRIPGASEKQTYKDIKFDGRGGIQFAYNDFNLVSGFVKEVENLSLEIDGEVKKIENGLDLANSVSSELPELFTEIRDYLFPETTELGSEGESKA